MKGRAQAHVAFSLLVMLMLFFILGARASDVDDGVRIHVSKRREATDVIEAKSKGYKDTYYNSTVSHLTRSRVSLDGGDARLKILTVNSSKIKTETHHFVNNVNLLFHPLAWPVLV
jgi:uncharacterized protein (UPF0333 family)